MNKAEKKYRIMSKKLIFVQTYTKFAVAMATSKVMDTIDIPKIYANDEQLQKFFSPVE